MAARGSVCCACSASLPAIWVRTHRDVRFSCLCGCANTDQLHCWPNSFEWGLSRLSGLKNRHLLNKNPFCPWLAKAFGRRGCTAPGGRAAGWQEHREDAPAPSAPAGKCCACCKQVCSPTGPFRGGEQGHKSPRQSKGSWKCPYGVRCLILKRSPRNAQNLSFLCWDFGWMAWLK